MGLAVASDDAASPRSSRSTIGHHRLPTWAIVVVIVAISSASIVLEGKYTSQVRLEMIANVIGGDTSSVNSALNSSEALQPSNNRTKAMASLPLTASTDNGLQTQSIQVPIDHTGQAKVYNIGNEYIFWEGKAKICDLLRNITQVSELGIKDPPHVKENLATPIVNVTWHCEDMLTNTGNWITAFYHLRLACALAQVDFQFQCSSGMVLAHRSVLPWLSGSYPVPLSETNANRTSWPYDLGWPSQDRVCSKQYKKLPIQHLGHVIQQDMRRMALRILGPRVGQPNITQSPAILHSLDTTTKEPFQSWKHAAVDDAAIHFRCGDVFGVTNKNYYGLIKFQEYADRIPQESTKSIGIHTQPFDKSLLREIDQFTVSSCKKVVHLFVDFLQERYPNATIQIRNRREDTIPLTYARLIMASQTITTMSTFGIFPGIGSFGEGYFQESEHQNRFALAIPEILPNVHTMTGPILSSPAIRKSKWEDIVKFLTSP